MHHSSFVAGERVLASLLCLTVASMGCVGGNAPPPAHAGSFDHEQVLRIAFKGFEVNAAGGNLAIRRRDFSIDTRLGTYELVHVYNSADEAWRWSHELELSAERFVDASGAVFDLQDVQAGERIAGSRWRLVDADTLRTLGGLEHHFDASGTLRVVHWQHAEYPQLRFEFDRIEQCTSPQACAEVFTIARDAEGRIVAIDDRAGRHASYAWDEHGGLRHALDPFSFEEGLPGTLYEYGGLFRGRVRALVHPDGERFEFEYGLMNGRVARVLEPGSPSPVVAFHYERDAATGTNSTRVTNALGATCVLQFDDLARPAAITNAAGESRTWTWSGLDKLSEVGPAGETTSWGHGPDWESETTPLGNLVTTVFASDALNREAPFARAVRVRSDSIGVIEERDYDAFGRIVARRDGAGTEETWSYHADGSVASSRAPGEGTLLYSQYGEHGHPGLIEQEDAELNDPFWDQPPQYDAVGNLTRGSRLTRLYDPGRPGIIERHFDAMRRISKLDVAGQELTPSSTVTLLTYSAGSIDLERRYDGQLTHVWRPYGADSEFDYDAAGRMTRRRDRVDGEWVDAFVATYDVVGNVVRLVHPNGVSDEMSFDAQNRPTLRRLLRDGIVEQNVSFTWLNGRLVSKTDSEFGAPETTTFDAGGNPLFVVYPGGEAMGRHFDLRGREALRRYWMPDGSGGFTLLRETTRSWDGADQAYRRWDEGQLVEQQVWDQGYLAEATTGNGLVRSFTRDALGRIEDAETVDAAASLVAKTSLYRATCVWTTITCLSSSTWTYEGPTLQSSETYHIDSHDFEALIPESAAGGRVLRWEGTAAGQTVYYHHDLLGSVTALGFEASEVFPLAGTAAVGWNAEHNRMLSLPDHRIGYDAATQTLVPSGGHSYAYDEAGFVTQRDSSVLSWTAEGRIAAIGADTFRWAIGGRPIERTLGGVTTRYLFDGSVTANAAGVPQRLRLGEGVEVDLISNERRYRHFDFRDNPSFTTGDAGEVLEHFEYEPTGGAIDRIAGDVPPAVDTMAFGQGDVLGNGLVLLGDRVLDTEAGRFLSPDPVWHVANQYSYAHGNPLWFRDFDGRLTIPTGPGELPISDLVEAAGEALIAYGQARHNKNLTALGQILVFLAHVLRLNGLEVHADGARLVRRRFGSADECASRTLLTDGPGSC